MADLASIISGTDPLAPLVLRAEQQQQLLNSARDASQWQNQGPFGALARTIAGIRGGGDNPALNQIVQQRAAAMPEVFQALASPNAYQYGAQHPETSPIGLASILANAPAAARANLEGATATGQGITNQLSGIDLAAYQQRQKALAGAGGQASGITAPAAPRGVVPPPLSGSPSPGGSVSPLVSPTAPAAEITQGALDSAQSALQMARSIQNPAQRLRYYQGLPPQVQAAMRHVAPIAPAGAGQ